MHHCTCNAFHSPRWVNPRRANTAAKHSSSTLAPLAHWRPSQSRHCDSSCLSGRDLKRDFNLHNVNHYDSLLVFKQGHWWVHWVTQALQYLLTNSRESSQKEKVNHGVMDHHRCRGMKAGHNPLKYLLLVTVRDTVWEKAVMEWKVVGPAP